MSPYGLEGSIPHSLGMTFKAYMAPSLLSTSLILLPAWPSSSQFLKLLCPLCPVSSSQIIVFQLLVKLIQASSNPHTPGLSDHPHFLPSL